MIFLLRVIKLLDDLGIEPSSLHFLQFPNSFISFLFMFLQFAFIGGRNASSKGDYDFYFV